MTIFEEIENAKNNFYVKLIKVVANKNYLNDDEINELLIAQQTLIEKILEFKSISYDTKLRKKISKELENIPCVAEEFVE